MHIVQIPIIVILVLAVIVGVQNCSCHTDLICDEKGTVINESVSEMVKLKIRAYEQWLLIRGYNNEAPVLLFLHGGPGFSELPLFKEYNGELEKYFVVVQWEQPGAGKSYSSEYKPGFIDADTLVETGLMVVSYLKERFRKEKIYLAGHCMGSILGIKMIQKQPSDFIAYVGISQHAYVKENLTFSYNLVKEKMKLLGNKQAVGELESISYLFAANSKANCFSAQAEKQFAVYIKWLTQSGGLFYGHTDRPKKYFELYFHASEYTLYEKMNLEQGTRLQRPIAESWYDLDFNAECVRVEVPVVFIMGKNDYHVISSVTRSWFEILSAPEKRFIIFDNSAHFPHFDEPSRFNAIMKELIVQNDGY